MKNLRKVLAVVLVVAMAFSFAAIASAKQVGDYSDASSVKYTEAVDLVTGLGIMTGSGGTTFDPTGTFTREQAAKVICYMLLGTNVAGSLSTPASRFKDVEAGRWSAPFIEYCAANGIIGGDGTGNFNPTAPITGSQMAKLILCALGYGAKGEYTGTAWEINALVKAQSLGILDTGVNYTAPATRQEVAKYVFNALTTCYAVTYNPVLGTYGNTSSSVVYDYQGLIYKFATLGYSSYSLLKVSAPCSYTGYAAHYWTAYNSTTAVTVSGTYSDDTVLATSMAGAPFNITNLTAPNSGFYKASLDYSFTANSLTGVKVFINGLQIGTAYTTLAGLTTKTTSAFVTVNGVSYPTAAQLAATTPGVSIDSFIGTAGVITKFLDNDKNGLAEVLYITVPTAAKAAVAPTVDAAGNVTISATAASGTYPKASISCPTGIDANNWFTFSNWNNGVLYIQKGTTGTGTVTGSTLVGGGATAINVTINGKAYSLAGYDGKSFMSTLSSGASNFNIPVTYWLDANGYAMYVQGTAASSYNYGLVLAYAYNDSGVAATAQAQVLTSDGKIAIYNIAVDPVSGVVPCQTTAGGRTVNASFGNIMTPGTLVSYAFDGSNNATLKNVGVVTGGVPTSALTNTYAAKASLVEVTAGSYFLNSATKVFYFNKGLNGGVYSSTANPASVLTGFGSTVTLATSGAVSYVVDPLNSQLLDAIYFNTSGPVGNSGNYVYFTSNAFTLRVVNGVNYYDYSGYVNGATTKTTLTATTDLTTQIIANGNKNGAYSYYTDASGNTTKFEALNSATTGYTGVNYTVTYVDSSVIGYTNGGTSGTFTVDSNTKFFKINPVSGACIAAPMVASISGGTTTALTNVVLSSATGNPALYVYYTVA